MMKKFGIVFTMILISMIILGTRCYADAQEILLTGENIVDTKQLNTLIIKVQSSEEIGAIEGVINYDSNIESLEMKSYDGSWTITTNNNTGKFNAYKPDGTKEGEIIKIEYKLKDEAKEGKIILKNIKVVTLSYETININDLTQTIYAKESKIQAQEQKNEQKQEKNQESGKGKEEKANKNEKDIVAPGNLPYTGITFNYVILAMIVTVFWSIIFYRKLNKYQGIK